MTTIYISLCFINFFNLYSGLLWMFTITKFSILGLQFTLITTFLKSSKWAHEGFKNKYSYCPTTLSFQQLFSLKKKLS